MNYIKSLFVSSTGEGVMLRLKSFALLLIPYVVDVINANLPTEQQVMTPGVQAWFNAVFVVAFGVTHLWGWIRSFRK